MQIRGHDSEDGTVAIKKILYATLILGTAAGLAMAGAPKAQAEPAEVTVYGHEAAARDTVLPGPDPIEGVGEGIFFAGKGVVQGGKEVVEGIGQSGGKVADDADRYGPPGLVTGTAKGIGRIGEGAVHGTAAIGGGAIKGAGCIVTFGAIC